MKSLILALCFSLSSQAANWMPHSKLKAGSSQAFQIEAECRRVSGENCYDLGDLPSSVYVEVDVQIDDVTKPIFLKEQVASCTGESDCQSKMDALVCQSQGYSPAKYLQALEVYCAKLNGYEQKTIKQMAQDSALVTAHNAAKVVEGQENAVKTEVEKAIADLECAQRIKALVKVRIKNRGLSKAQRKALTTALATVYTYLGVADFPVVKDEVALLTADGTVLLNADKTALTNQIDKCMAASP